MGNVRGGVMAHSYSSLGIQNMLLNGKPVGVFVGITGNAAWAGIVMLLRRHWSRSKEVRATVCRQRHSADGSVDTVWVEYEGPTGELPDVLEHLDPPNDAPVARA